MKREYSEQYLRIFVIILLDSIIFIPHNHLAHAEVASAGLMVPLYTFPGSTWDTVVEAKNARPAVSILVIINPHNGPGNATDTIYVTGIQKLQSAGIVVLGYIHTNYTSRNSVNVMTDIDNYKNWYNVNGIFFDEMSNAAGNEGYYSNLNGYAKSLGLIMTVGNSGVDTLPSYIGTVDNIVIHDNSNLPSDSLLGGWHTNHAKSNFSILSYGIDSLDQAYVGHASNYVQYMYMTNDITPNPWDSLPPYLSNLVTALPASASLTVKTVQMSGNPLPGYYTSVQLNGNLLTSGFTTITFGLNSGQTYNVIAYEFGDYYFDHWQDNGDTSRYRDISMSTDTEWVAVYRNINDPPALGNSKISISAVDSFDNTMSGYYASLWQNGIMVEAGFVPLSFTVDNSQTYQVAVADYGDYVFDHWSDGTLTRFYEVTTGAETTTNLIAVYRTASS